MTIRRAIILCLLLLAAAALRAEEPAARFFVERIDVRDAHHVSRDVVIAESRLREGQTYTEQELREGSLRLNRAPYLLSADFSLEKGSERGKYVLVITVIEAKPFFYLFDGVFYIPRDSNARIELANNAVTDENVLATGFRFFVGPRGAVHLGIEGTADNRSYTNDYSSFVVGYTQYDLLGTRAFATFNIKRPITTTNNETSRITPQVVIGVPLSLNQTLTLDYDQSDFGTSSGSGQQSQRILTARWSYNTTNHPLFPSRGTILTATPVVVWNDSVGFDVEPITRKQLPFATHDRSLGLEATAARFWEVGDRDSIFASAGAGFARTRERGVRVLDSRFGPRTVDSNYGLLDFGFAHSLWTPERVAKDGTSRIEADLHYGRHVDDRFIGYVYEKLNSREASVSWVRRNAWGTLRLGVGYSW